MRKEAWRPALISVDVAMGSVADAEDTMLNWPPPTMEKGEPQMGWSVWLKGSICHASADDVSIISTE
jgi:hypothetical protein